MDRGCEVRNGVVVMNDLSVNVLENVLYKDGVEVWMKFDMIVSDIVYFVNDKDSSSSIVPANVWLRVFVYEMSEKKYIVMKDVNESEKLSVEVEDSKVYSVSPPSSTTIRICGVSGKYEVESDGVGGGVFTKQGSTSFLFSMGSGPLISFVGDNDEEDSLYFAGNFIFQTNPYSLPLTILFNSTKPLISIIPKPKPTPKPKLYEVGPYIERSSNTQRSYVGEYGYVYMDGWRVYMLEKKLDKNGVSVWVKFDGSNDVSLGSFDTPLPLNIWLRFKITEGDVNNKLVVEKENELMDGYELVGEYELQKSSVRYFGDYSSISVRVCNMSKKYSMMGETTVTFSSNDVPVFELDVDSELTVSGTITFNDGITHTYFDPILKISPVDMLGMKDYKLYVDEYGCTTSLSSTSITIQPHSHNPSSYTSISKSSSNQISLYNRRLSLDGFGVDIIDENLNNRGVFIVLGGNDGFVNVLDNEMSVIGCLPSGKELCVCVKNVEDVSFLIVSDDKEEYRMRIDDKKDYKFDCLLSTLSLKGVYGAVMAEGGGIAAFTSGATSLFSLVQNTDVILYGGIDIGSVKKTYGIYSFTFFKGVNSDNIDGYYIAVSGEPTFFTQLLTFEIHRGT